MYISRLLTNNIKKMNPIPSYEYEKYITDPSNLMGTINAWGVAIIPNVLTSEECESMVSGVWDFFEHISKKWTVPINRNKSETWAGFYKLFPLHSMLYQSWNVGHAQVSWDLRQKQKIIDIFCKIHNCSASDLLVSFDGLSFHMPPETTGRGYHRSTWYHTDQSYTRNDFECIQSWVTGLDVEDGDATLAFLEGSNKYHNKFGQHLAESGPLSKDDWYKLDEAQTQYYKDLGCEPKRIKCPKGSMVFWDSRTIHCGTESLKARANPKPRCVVYLCYMPTLSCSEANIRKRIKAFEELRTISHWANKPKLFGVIPRTYGAEIPEINQIEPPVLSRIGKSLVGYSD